METKFQTSFIPKAGIDADVRPARPRRSPAGLLLSLCILIFIFTLVIFAGCIGYKAFIDKQIADIKVNIDKNIKAFEEDTIRSYARLDLRMDTASELLQNHTAASAFLDFLQRETLKSVRFNDFKYEYSFDPAGANVSMSGIASGYNAVAYQSVVFGQNRRLIDPIFSNLDLNDKGNVVFTFSTKIKPDFVYYKSQKRSASDIQTAPTQTGQTAPVIPESEDSPQSAGAVAPSAGTQSGNINVNQTR